MPKTRICAYVSDDTWEKFRELVSERIAQEGVIHGVVSECIEEAITQWAENKRQKRDNTK
jgi:hypothetical protein